MTSIATPHGMSSRASVSDLDDAPNQTSASDPDSEDGERLYVGRVVCASCGLVLSGTARTPRTPGRLRARVELIVRSSLSPVCEGVTCRTTGHPLIPTVQWEPVPDGDEERDGASQTASASEGGR